MDAVPGRNATNATESTPDTTYCQPCFEDDKKLPPEAFCPVCSEFLCSTCARVHGNMKLTRSHPLQDKSSMSSSFRTDSADEYFTETCKLHVNEFVKYYCAQHTDLLCGYCVVGNEEHRSCNVEKIYQVAKRYKEGSEYNCLMTGLGEIVNDIENYSSNLHASMESVDEESLSNINELRKFRNEINLCLDKREKELLEEIDQKKRKSTSLLNELNSKCKSVKQASEKLKSELQAQVSSSNQLFIVGKRAVKELSSLKKALNEVDRMREVPQYSFHRDSSTEQLLVSITAIGKVEEKESISALIQQQRKYETIQQQRQQGIWQQQPVHEQDLSKSKFSRQPAIPVKTSEDTSDCFLPSLALLPGDRLLLADGNNDSVKLVNTKSNKVVSQMKLSSSPWDLCLLPGDRAAITLPEEGIIQFVSTKGEVTLQGIIKVGVNCYGIDFCDDNLIVSFVGQGKVVLMDVNGTLRKSVDTDSNEDTLFHVPSFLTVTRDSRTQAIFVSDSHSGIMTKLSISLEVLETFIDPALTEPYGMSTLGDNQLLLCRRNNNSIVLLDTFTGKITQLLGKGEGIERPYSVAYCQPQKRMFVTGYSLGRPKLNNCVQVFNSV